MTTENNNKPAVKTFTIFVNDANRNLITVLRDIEITQLGFTIAQLKKGFPDSFISSQLTKEKELSN